MLAFYATPTVRVVEKIGTKLRTDIAFENRAKPKKQFVEISVADNLISVEK